MEKKMTEEGVVDVDQVIPMAKDTGLFGSAGSAEKWDFSYANSNQQARIDAVQKVASICFQSNVKVGTSALYDKLHAESLGLPSSSFEFVPVLLNSFDAEFINNEYMRHLISGMGNFTQGPHIEKYGMTVVYGRDVYRLTNLRALLYDIEIINKFLAEDERIDPSERFFNTDPTEIALIHENFYVFHTEIDIVTARQFMRHRTSWQELSRRYVSGKKVPFEVYLTEDMLSDKISVPISEHRHIDATSLVMLALQLYDKAIENGVKPQDARRIIPQGAITKIWSAWFKPQFDDMVELRSAGKAQWEVRTLAKSMRGLVERTR